MGGGKGGREGGREGGSILTGTGGNGEHLPRECLTKLAFPLVHLEMKLGLQRERTIKRPLSSPSSTQGFFDLPFWQQEMVWVELEEGRGRGEVTHTCFCTQTGVVAALRS